jgi:hypothetical protein
MKYTNAICFVVATKALGYEAECRGFETRLDEILNFIILPAALGLGGSLSL